MTVVALPTADAGVVEMLEEALRDAKRDKAQAVALVVVSDSGIATMLYGDLIALNYGVDLLKARMFDE